MRQRARADNLTVCYCKKQMDISISFICLVIDNKFCHNIIKVVCRSTRHNVMTKFLNNNKADAWKTDVNLLNLLFSQIYILSFKNPFPSSLFLLFQTKFWYIAFHVEMSLICRTMTMQDKKVVHKDLLWNKSNSNSEMMIKLTAADAWFQWLRHNKDLTCIGR